MKIASIILAVYTLVLAVIPCHDEGKKSDDCAESAVCDHLYNGSQQEEGVDMCSPFCLCSCCQGTTLTSHTNTSGYFPAISLISGFYSQNSLSSHYKTIWQPPRA